MVNFSAKFKELFKRNGNRGGRAIGPSPDNAAPGSAAAQTTTAKKDTEAVLSSQVHIAGQLYYIRNRTAPYHLMQDLNAPPENVTTTAVESRTRLQGKNGAVVLYSTTFFGGNTPPPQETPTPPAEKTTYEMVLEVLPLQELEITLLLTNQLEVATAQLASPAMAILNGFVPFLVEGGSRSAAFSTVVELLECFAANPSWTVHHFAAYFNWDNHFTSSSTSSPIPLQELENRENPGGWSVLHVAVYCGGKRLLEALLQTGMDVHLVDSKGATVMHYAVQAKGTEDDEGAGNLVGFLVDRPAFYEQLKVVDSEGRTPLYVAFTGQYLGAVRRLLAQGLTAKMLSIGKPEVPKEGGNLTANIDASPYVTFSEEELARGLAVGELGHGGSPLHWANDFDLLERLLKLQAFRVNGRNLQGDTPLIAFIRRLGAQEAASLDSTVVKVSNKKTTGHSPTPKRGGVLKKSGGGGTPLKAPGKAEAAAAWRQLASARRHCHYRLSWILRLLTAGGRVNATNHQTGETALHYAVLAHDIASIQALIIFGARLNMRDKAGVSALHMACAQLKSLAPGDQENTTQQQQKGGKKSKSPKKSAEEARTVAHYQQIIRLLVESGARRCPPLKQTSSNENDDGGGGVSLNQPANPQCGPQCAPLGGSWASKSEAYVKVDIRTVDDHCRLRLVRGNKGGVPAPPKINQPPPLKRGNNSSTVSVDVHVEGSSSSKARASSTTSPKSPPEGEGASPSMDPLTSEDPLTEEKSPSIVKTPSKKAQRKSQSTTSPSPSTVNMITFDGGDSYSGIRPLIQALILNELENYLPRPLHAYFTVVGGASFGATAAALFSTRRTAAETFYFFLRLKEDFKSPVLQHMTANGAHLETVLKREFGSEKDDGLRVESVAGPPYSKHLMLFSTLVDREPVVQNVFSSYRNPGPQKAGPITAEDNTSSSSSPFLWWACRAASCSLYCYATFYGHYDNGLHASNPTMDVLAKYEAARAELKAAAKNAPSSPPKPLPPLNLVLSVGCGSKPVQLNTGIKELGVGPLSFKFLDLPYIIQLRDVCFEVITEQNGFIAERAAVWAGSVGAHYSRLNFVYTKPKVAAEEAEAAAKKAKKTRATAAAKRVPSEGRPDKAYLGKVTAGTLRSAPAARIIDDDGHLLQTLWAVKLQMLARRSFFVRVAKALEEWITAEQEKKKESK